MKIVLSLVIEQRMNSSISQLQRNNWINNYSRCNYFLINVIAVIIDFNLQTYSSYYALREAYELTGQHIFNVHKDIFQIPLNPLDGNQIFLLIIYVLPSLVFVFRTIFEICLYYSVFINLIELMHLAVVFIYFILCIVMYFCCSFIIVAHVNQTIPSHKFLVGTNL